MKIKTCIFIFCLALQGTWAQTTFNVKQHFKEAGISEIMILGSFHFNNPGLDTYKPKYEVDILSATKQQELLEVIEAIKKFGPTKIAIEVRKEGQGRIDSLYNAYLKGKFKLKRNETYQIGFRLAKMLGHKKVYAVDASAKRDNLGLTDAQYKEKENYFIGKARPDLLQREVWLDQKFNAMYEFEDQLKTQVSLLDYFLFMNDPEITKASHGHYLIANFKMGEGTDYFGPDDAMWWYNRNLRIFHNLLKINEPGKDKIFVLFGAGHVPILDFLADTSIEFEKKVFQDYVNK
ncbi:DUF5694 domain-containing protein [Spongiimicrobium salis]|uniref:DUF5694 domain-containing protein n=1 Tax=Spongiimicrobium salis TaxID=1667022 RepID=UPI00374D8EA4